MNLNKILLATLCLTALVGCSDDFLENAPQGVLSSSQEGDPVFADLMVNAAYATFGGRYTDSDSPQTLPVTNWSYGEVRADNAYKGGGGLTDVGEVHDMETMKVQTNNGNVDGKSFQLYNAISRCHAAIRAVRACDPAEYPDQELRIAEMHVIRAHWYFELVRMFNKIPYMDENLPENEYVNVPNDLYSRDEHLARIADELLDAAKILPEVPQEVGRMSARIARAYAAKVKLYRAYEQNPVTHAVVGINKTLLGEVIELIDGLSGYDLFSDFQDLDLVAKENGCESVFAFQYSVNDGSIDGGRINWSNLLNSPGGNSPYHGDGFFLPSQDLINAYQTDANGLPEFDYQSLPDYGVVKFDENDHTRWWVENTSHTVDPRLDFVVGRPTITYKTYKETPCMLWSREPDVYGYNCAKRFWVSPESDDMRPGWPWGASALNWQVIRWADLLLYKAEAMIEIGTDIPGAMQLINKVRGRAKNSAYVRDFNDPSRFAANYNIELYPLNVSQDYARKALRMEMRLEKAMEGERFFDLVRWGIAKEVMNKYFAVECDNRPYYNGAVFNDGEEYFPITTQQYEFSLHRYTQNPGYPAF